MGRPRDVGSEKWATVSECAEALGVTYQAIRNRMNAGTIPFEQHIEGERPSYRIHREWLNAELARKGTPATFQDAHERTLDILTAFHTGVEVIRHEVEVQHTQLVPLLEKALENQARMLGDLEAMRIAQDEMFKLIRSANARLEEADRKEREYQQENLALQRELRDLVKEAREENTAARRERQNRGLPERRSWLRRFLGG